MDDVQPWVWLLIVQVKLWGFELLWSIHSLNLQCEWGLVSLDLFSWCVLCSLGCWSLRDDGFCGHCYSGKQLCLQIPIFLASLGVEGLTKIHAIVGLARWYLLPACRHGFAITLAFSLSVRINLFSLFVATRWIFSSGGPHLGWAFTIRGDWIYQFVGYYDLLHFFYLDFQAPYCCVSTILFAFWGQPT